MGLIEFKTHEARKGRPRKADWDDGFDAQLSCSGAQNPEEGRQRVACSMEAVSLFYKPGAADIQDYQGQF